MLKKLNLSIVLIVYMAFSQVACGQQQYDGPVLKVQKDKLYQLIRMSVKEGKKSQLDEYFGKIGPKIGESGAKVYSFGVLEAGEGNGPAQVILIAEYADESAADIIFESKEFLQNRNTRDHALSYLSEGYYRATTDGEFPIGEEGRLEWISMWMEDDGQDKLNEYFGAIMPEVTELGGKAAPFAFVPALERGNYHAHSVILAHWKSEEARDTFFAGKTFADNKDKRNAALKFLEEYKIQFIPEQGQ